jgi:hypothetical protein
MYNDIVHTEEFNGYTINIRYDEGVECPFDDWDCEPPLAVYSAGNRGINEYSVGYGNVNSVPELSRVQIIANKDEILSMLGYQSFLQIRDDLHFFSDTDIVEYLNEQIGEYVYSLSDSERLDVLCDLYAMVGMPAVVKDVRGYSQGDWAKVLAVATPEFQEACGNGADFDWIESLKGSIQLFEDWAFGNVYGYQVLDANDEEIDSCWGFFGDYDKPFGAVHEAQAAINWRIACDKKERIEQIKTWIRNRVPFQYRLTA